MSVKITDNVTPYLEQMGQRANRVGEAMAASVVDLFQRRYDEFDESRANKLGGKRTHFWGKVSKSVHYTNLTPEGFDVDVTHIGVRLHWLGGTIEPGKGISFITGRPTQYLTIPADAEAHGRRAKEFQDLKVLWGKNGPWALAIAPNAAARRQIALNKFKRMAARTTAQTKGARTLFKPVLGSAYETFSQILNITKYGAGKERLAQFKGSFRILFRLVKQAVIHPDDEVVPSEEEIVSAASEAASKYIMGGAVARAQREETG